jgi:carboxymethylenebutenolidase
MSEPHRAGTGYLVLPDGDDSGPGVLVLHAWWGLTPFFKQVCDRLADQGFVALAPDLLGGQTVDTAEEAERLLAESDVEAMQQLVRSSLFTLRAIPATPDAPVGVVGFSMGASWALWLASREAEHIGATVVFYGTQSVDMSPAGSPFLGHFAETDAYVADEEITLLQADLELLDKDVTFHRYPETEHWFFESDRPAYDETSARLAWQRTVAFLHQHLDARNLR